MYIITCYKTWNPQKASVHWYFYFNQQQHPWSIEDTVEELGAMGTSAVDDFDWLVQLRYYIEADTIQRGFQLGVRGYPKYPKIDGLCHGKYHRNGWWTGGPSMTLDTSISGFRELLRSWASGVWNKVLNGWNLSQSRVLSWYDLLFAFIINDKLTDSKKKVVLFWLPFFDYGLWRILLEWMRGWTISFLSQENPEKPQQQDLCLTECSMGSRGPMGTWIQGIIPSIGRTTASASEYGCLSFLVSG